MDILCREVKPFVPPVMTEIFFWLRAMKEHALFICLGLPAEQVEMRRQAEEFGHTLARLEQAENLLSGGYDFDCFLRELQATVRGLTAFKRHILHLQLECCMTGGCLYPLLIDHMSREAVYFLKLLRKVHGHGGMPFVIDAMLSENVFWLRLTTDHLAFARGMVDPADRTVLEQIAVQAGRFEELGLKARDLSSLLWHYCPTNDFIRFERDVAGAACDVKEFFAVAERLVKECSALSVINPLLIEHIRREAEHFGEVLELIRAEMAKEPAPSAAG